MSHIRENKFTHSSIYNRLVPGLKNMPVPVLVTLKIRYTNRKAPAQRPFLLAGELASPAGRVLVVLGWVLGQFTCKIWDRELSYCFQKFFAHHLLYGVKTNYNSLSVPIFNKKSHRTQARHEPRNILNFINCPIKCLINCLPAECPSLTFIYEYAYINTHIWWLFPSWSSYIPAMQGDSSHSPGCIMTNRRYVFIYE